MLESRSDVLWTSRTDARVEIIGGAAARREAEEQLLQRGVPIPFASRAAVSVLPEYASGVFLAVRDDAGETLGGITVHERRAPFLRSHQLLRVEQFGASLPVRLADAAVRALVQWIHTRRTILRTSVDVFSLDEASRRALGDILQRHGFRRAEHVNGYTETLVTDLARPEEEVFASLHHSARRKIRQVARAPVAVLPVLDPFFAPRMNALMQETLVRTRGPFQPRDWQSRIELSRTRPDLSRIIGLFRTDVAGPDALLAFAWGCHSGDLVYYSEAASTRNTGALRVPLAYALMWDLIVWARTTGARWFDYGGVTRGTHGDDDPLSGISDFKRYFSRQMVRVRDEWILEGHSWRSAIAAAVHRRVRAR